MAFATLEACSKEAQGVDPVVDHAVAYPLAVGKTAEEDFRVPLLGAVVGF